MPPAVDDQRQVFLHPTDRRKAQKRRYASARWDRVRALVLERDGGVCQIKLDNKCRVTANVVDHIVRPEDGGAEYDPDNLRAACRSCNMRRHDIAFYRAKADGVPNPYTERPGTWSEAGRPSSADKRFIEWALALHGVGGEPTDHDHGGTWPTPNPTVYTRGRAFRVCSPACRSPVRWPA